VKRVLIGGGVNTLRLLDVHLVEGLSSTEMWSESMRTEGRGGVASERGGGEEELPQSMEVERKRRSRLRAWRGRGGHLETSGRAEALLKVPVNSVSAQINNI